MKPSDVDLFWAGPHMPLLDTFGRVEREYAAALLVRTCEKHGDKWQWVTPWQVGQSLKADAEGEGPWGPVCRNPLLRPDMGDLVKHGYAEFEHAGDGAPIRFTAKGLEALARRQRGTQPASASR